MVCLACVAGTADCTTGIVAIAGKADIAVHAGLGLRQCKPMHTIAVLDQ